MNNIDELQQKAFDKFSKLRVGALFMKAGSGKTKVAMSLVKQKEKDFEAVIWIAPASLIYSKNYQDNLKRWIDYTGIVRPFHYFTAEGVASSDKKYLELLDFVKKNKCFCVIDESLKIKNLTAKKTGRLLNMSDLFKFKLILNGTPITKGLYDLYPQIEFLSPKILNMSEREFAYKFLEFKKDGRNRSWTQWSRPANEEALIEILKPYIFDEDLEKYADLNVKLRQIPMSNYEEYEDAKKEFSQKSADDFSFLALTQKLKSIYEGGDGGFEALKEDVAKIEGRGEKVIIYVSFLKQVETIENLFGSDKVAIFTGKEKAGLSEFKTHKNIMVSTYGCGSLGLNLQFCNNIIYFSQTFNYADKEQSLHRIYRMGQERKCNVINYVYSTGLCKLIMYSLEKKENTLNNIKNLVKTKGIEVL